MLRLTKVTTTETRPRRNASALFLFTVVARIYRRSARCPGQRIVAILCKNPQRRPTHPHFDGSIVCRRGGPGRISKGLLVACDFHNLGVYLVNDFAAEFCKVLTARCGNRLPR